MRDPAGLDALLAEAVARPPGLPGLVAAAVTRDGGAYLHAAGLRQAGGTEAMTPDTVFGMASMTKAITAVAAMRLVEQGALSLDAPASRLLPELAAIPVLEGFAPDGTPRLRPARVPVTLRHLLTHTSGFAYDFANADLDRYLVASGIPPARGCALESFRAPMLFDPGTRWEYGTGIDWVGRLIEAATGTRLDRHLRAAILDPLGMTDTGFEPDAAALARRAAMHRRAPDGTLTAASPAPLPEFGFYPGGSRIFSTAPDYLRFLRMLLGEGSLDGVRLLRPETVRDMLRDHTGGHPVRALPAIRPELTNPFDLLPGVACGWSLLGLRNTDPLPGRRSAGSLAWAGIANTYYWLDPERGTAGLLLAQVSPFLDPSALAAFEAFERAVFERS